MSGTGTPQIGNDLLTYSNANASETTVDMTAQNPLDEDAIAPKAGWAGQTITGLRFDPNEDPGKAVWHLKSVHLRADPTATGSTTVTFHDNAWVSGATADVAVRIGSGSWQRIAAGVAVVKGTNSVPFSLGTKPAGKYGVRVTVHHPDGSAAAADASAPVVMKKGAAAAPDTSHDPRGTLDAATAGSAGVTLSGWAYDPDTRDPLAVALYDTTSGAKSLGRVSTSIARPDVVRAHPAHRRPRVLADGRAGEGHAQGVRLRHQRRDRHREHAARLSLGDGPLTRPGRPGDAGGGRNVTPGRGIVALS